MKHTHVLMLDGWAGRIDKPIVLVGETPKRYKVRLLEDTLLPRRRVGKKGDVVLVPKNAVKEVETI
ncbi:hypothetical protein E2P64_06515 [Candidatus Bathyarchaeota archaeon]|nr:hypothetical protein E2P64_06515 [Candidatus Bathyarchaeota archaeon]